TARLFEPMYPDATVSASINSMTAIRDTLVALGIGVAIMVGHASETTATDSPGTIPIVGETGHPPDDFRPDRTGQGTTGQWIIVSDPTAEGGRALEQVNPDHTDYRFPLAI